MPTPATYQRDHDVFPMRTGAEFAFDVQAAVRTAQVEPGRGVGLFGGKDLKKLDRSLAVARVVLSMSAGLGPHECRTVG